MTGPDYKHWVRVRSENNVPSWDQVSSSSPRDGHSSGWLSCSCLAELCALQRKHAKGVPFTPQHACMHTAQQGEAADRTEACSCCCTDGADSGSGGRAGKWLKASGFGLSLKIRPEQTSILKSVRKNLGKHIPFPVYSGKQFCIHHTWMPLYLVLLLHFTIP